MVVMGPIEKQEIGDSQVHCKGHDRPAEADGENRKGRKEERTDEESKNRAGRGWDQGQKPDEGPRKGKDQQKGDTDRRQEDRHPHIPPGGIFVVQGGAIGPDGGEDKSGTLGLILTIELLRQLIQERGDGTDKGRIRRRTGQFRYDQQMGAVLGQQMTPVHHGVPGRQDLRHPRQNEVPDAQGITGEDPGLTDPLQVLQQREILRQSLTHLRRLEERSDLRLQLRTVEQQGQVSDDVADEFRHQRLHLPHADLPEETALHEPGLNQLGPGHQIIPRTSPDLAVDDQPVLNGKMTDDPVGIRQDRVVTGHRCQDVGIDLDIGGYI
jgi:hypothetical protein